MGVFDSSKKKRTDVSSENSKRPRTAPGEWQIGDKIQGNYEIRDIKMGGMGIVYICYDHESMEPIAIKTFQNRYLSDKAVIERFKWEAETWVKLEKHPNIVTAKYVEDINNRPYIFLEYIAGDVRYGADLSSWVYSGGLGPVGQPDVPLILNFALQFCHGMMHAEVKFKETGKPFIHQDIKPQNIMVTKEKTFKVTDFGLVRAFTEMVDDIPSVEVSNTSSHRFSFSKSGVICGTPPYMSPEQCRGEKNIDTRSDIYSFGCVLYEVLTHKSPFLARTLDGYIQHHLKTIPESPNADIKLDQVVLKCLEKEPNKRYQNFAELERAISRLYQEFTGQVVKPTEVVTLESWELNNKGVSLLNLGRYQDALDCFNEALNIDDKSFIELWNNKGNALIELKRYQEALVCYDKALEINPQDSSTWTNKGSVLLNLKKHKEALDCFDRVLLMDPNNTRAKFLKYMLLFSLYGKDKAKKWLENQN